MLAFRKILRTYYINDPIGDFQPIYFNALLCSTVFYKEAVTRRCSVKKAFLEISQNSQENTRARNSFLIKLQA